jgi:hypothetical protein
MKDNIVSLYNALNHTAHDADNITEITTLDDVVYIKMKNDVSLLINSYMPLWEHQSTYNPNMPVKKAVDEAVKRCIKEDILRDFLKKHRAEVMNVCMTEYNEEVFVNGMLEAGRQEGFKRLNRLIAILIEQKRYDDLERSTRDAQFQAQLLAELVPEQSWRIE